MLALVSASATASSFFERPFPETVRDAPNIVRGKIGKSETRWTTLPDGSKRLFTYYDVDVTEGFKGGPRPGTPIRIRELGGSKDGVSLNVSGTASFEKGEDVVVMLGENSGVADGSYPLLGMIMGKFNLEKDADGKEYLRGPGIGSSVQPSLRHDDDRSGGMVSLESLREIVRIQANDAKTKPADATPTPAAKPAGALLTGNEPRVSESPKEVHEEGLVTKPMKGDSSRRALVFGVGILIGVAWFLNSRKKRR